MLETLNQSNQSDWHVWTGGVTIGTVFNSPTLGEFIVYAGKPTHKRKLAADMLKGYEMYLYGTE